MQHIYQPELEEVKRDLRLLELKIAWPIRCTKCNKRLVKLPDPKENDLETPFCDCRLDPEWYQRKLENTYISNIARILRTFIPNVVEEVHHDILLEIFGDDYTRTEEIKQREAELKAEKPKKRKKKPMPEAPEPQAPIKTS